MGRQLLRTVAGHGETQQELRRLDGAVHFMESKGLRLSYAVVGDRVLDLTSRVEQEDAFTQVKQRIITLQSRQGLPTYWIEVLETETGLHSNLIYASHPAIDDALRRAFPEFMSGKDAVQHMPAPHDRRRVIEYLSHERTPQASVALGLARKKGAFHLDGGGDRVRLSKTLKQDAIEARLVEPWQATNARRQPVELDRRKGRSGRKPLPPVPQTAMLETQLELFARTSPARLRVFHGGLMPTAVALETRHLQRRHGLSQQQLADKIGISRPQLANGLQGTYGLSNWASARLREALIEARAA